MEILFRSYLLNASPQLRVVFAAPWHTVTGSCLTLLEVWCAEICFRDVVRHVMLLNKKLIVRKLVVKFFFYHGGSSTFGQFFGC